VGVDGNEAMSWCIWKFQEERRKKKDGETSPVADKNKNTQKHGNFLMEDSNFFLASHLPILAIACLVCYELVSLTV
jgi:hypothetical protein